MKINTKQIALMAMLIALSVVSRIALTFIPNVQATTVIVILSSFILNPFGAVVVATGSALLSNMVLGMGIWTLWQIVSWSLVGLMSGFIGRYHRKIPLPILSLYAGFCGLFYGFSISLPMSKMIGNFWIYYLSGLPFDIIHAIGNIVFLYILYPIFLKVVDKYKK